MTTFYGNQVAYGNGGWFRVVLDVWDDGGNTGTSTTVHYQYGIQFNVSIGDSDNALWWSDPWGTGRVEDVNYSFGSGGGQRTVSGPHSNQAGIQYGGGNSLRFTLSANGLAGVGGTSTVDINYYLPGRHAAPPEPPTIGVTNITASSLAVYCTAGGAENGSTTDAINYRIHRTADGAHLGDLQGGYGGVTFGGLTHATAYTFFAQAHNGAGWGNWSAGVTVATSPLPPSPPSIAVKDVTATSATIYTTGPGAENGATTDVLNYRVHRNSDGAHMGDSWGGYAGVSFTNLARVTGYTAYAQARNSAGWGSFSAGVPFTTAATAPDAPTAVKVTSVTSVGASVTFTASNNGGSPVTGVEVQVATNAAFTQGARLFATTTLTGLTPGTPQYVRVRQKNAAGTGAWSSAVSFTTLASVKVWWNDAWVDAVPYVFWGGQWVPAAVYSYHDGAWRL